MIASIIHPNVFGRFAAIQAYAQDPRGTTSGVTLCKTVMIGSQENDLSLR
jgi:hypothetical protein